LTKCSGFGSVVQIQPHKPIDYYNFEQWKLQDGGQPLFENFTFTIVVFPQWFTCNKIQKEKGIGTL